MDRHRVPAMYGKQSLIGRTSIERKGGPRHEGGSRTSALNLNIFQKKMKLSNEERETKKRGEKERDKTSFLKKIKVLCEVLLLPGVGNSGQEWGIPGQKKGRGRKRESSAVGVQSEKNVDEGLDA